MLVCDVPFTTNWLQTLWKVPTTILRNATFLCIWFGPWRNKKKSANVAKARFRDQFPYLMTMGLVLTGILYRIGLVEVMSFPKKKDKSAKSSSHIKDSCFPTCSNQLSAKTDLVKQFLFLDVTWCRAVWLALISIVRCLQHDLTLQNKLRDYCLLNFVPCRKHT